MDIKSIEQIYIVLVFLAPGLIAVYFRSLFITGRRPKTLEYTVEYVIISAVYFALALPLVELVIAIREPNWLRVMSWTALLGILPALIGVVLGAGSQKGWWRFVFGKARLSLVSSYPTAWDWVFGRLRGPTYIMVTMEDGSRVAGLFGWDSLASSNPEERDLYIDEVYDFDDAHQWTPRTPKQSILVPYRNVKYIEFWLS